MPLDLNSQFELHGRALSVANQRLEVLAANVANADTPNYKARDIDFRAAMATAGRKDGLGGALPMAQTRAGHIQTATGGQFAVTPQYRVPDQPSLDGNTVDSQKESAAIAETAVRYQATLTFLSAKIRGMRDAFTGGR
jgi:flagellar basal-body rod protein FlgB